MTFLNELKFDRQGLITAIIQDHKTGEVLMVGHMNREALQKTLAGPYVTFWSRSRQKIWVKGEESGHTQTVREIFVDCDQDAVLIKVDQKVAACHEGYHSCFFRKMEANGLKIIGQKMFNPKETYKR